GVFVCAGIKRTAIQGCHIHAWKNVAGWIVLLVGSALITGCASYRDATSYSRPAWTAEGNIVAVKTAMKFRKSWIEPESLADARMSIVQLDAEGRNEQELMEVNEHAIALVQRSPLGNYLAYLDANYNLKVFRKQAGRWSLNWQKKQTSDTDRIRISPDEANVYVSAGAGSFKLYTINGILFRESDLGGGGGFRSSTEIVLNKTNTEIGKTVFLNIETSAVIEAGRGFAFDEYVIEENSVVSDSGDFIETLDLDTQLVTTYNITYAPYQRTDFTGQSISPDGKKMVMSFNGISDLDSGVILLNIETSEIKRIR
ncbi:hypothetical protein EBR96_07145, partial [bacterium]|nr:hypothetical protein [bacterium]